MYVSIHGADCMCFVVDITLQSCVDLYMYNLHHYSHHNNVFVCLQCTIVIQMHVRVATCTYIHTQLHSTHTRVVSYLTHMLFLILPPSAVMNYDMDVARSIAVFIGGIVVLTFIAERFHRG